MSNRRSRIILRVLGIFLSDPALLFSLLRNLTTIRFQQLLSRFRRGNLKIIALTEHIGDLTATEPVIRFLHSQYKGAQLVWIVDKKYALIPASHPLIHKVYTVTCFSEWIILRRFLGRAGIFDLHIHGKVCNRYGLLFKGRHREIHTGNYLGEGNLLYCFSRSAGLPVNEKIAPRIYLEQQTPSLELAGEFIVVHTSSNNPEKDWLDEGWNLLADHILHSSSLGVVEIGFLKKIHSASERYLDFTGRRKLEEIAWLINHCRLFVGIDSGFAHFANAMTKPAFILLGPYNQFATYQPYSGLYLDEPEHLFRAGCSLHTLGFDSIESALNRKLRQLALTRLTQNDKRR